VTEVIRDIVDAVGPMEGVGILLSRRRLLKQLRSRDADAAELEMTAHLQKVHAFWLNGGPARRR
jgi:DNA-binding FadR family transcriptional regulator